MTDLTQDRLNHWSTDFGIDHKWQLFDTFSLRSHGGVKFSKYSKGSNRIATTPSLVFAQVFIGPPQNFYLLPSLITPTAFPVLIVIPTRIGTVASGSNHFTVFESPAMSISSQYKPLILGIFVLRFTACFIFLFASNTYAKDYHLTLSEWWENSSSTNAVNKTNQFEPPITSWPDRLTAFGFLDGASRF